ncbi:MAG TPA: hypothetical protein VGG14_17445 [Candidatus Sulfotelmatobacter sp.]
MLPKIICTVGLLIALPAFSQQSGEPSSTQPQVKVNVLNVCTPSAEEQKEISSALARIPKQPAFGADFEISHGVSTLTDAPNFLQPGQNTQVSDQPSVARYVRIRREFSGQAAFSSVQYSFSDDSQSMVETLVLHVRDPKELIQISLEDSASAIGTVASMVAANTPVNRIRLERFGKSSVALARCSASENGPTPDQTVYEPLFRTGSEILSDYRHLLGAKRTVIGELAQISSGASTKVKASKTPNQGNK